jgi:hypothetical protein
MNIVIDLDNTLFYNHIVDFMCASYSIPRGNRQDLMDLPEEVRSKCFEAFGHAYIMGNLTPFNGAIGVDKTLVDMGHKVYVVTARDGSMKKETLAMVKKYFPHVTKTVLVGSYDKYDIYKKLKADMVIDDHFHHIQEAKMAGVPHVVMISNPNTPYNHKYVECVKGMEGAVLTNISEFKDVFVKWQNQLDAKEHKNDLKSLVLGWTA